MENRQDASVAISQELMQYIREHAVILDCNEHGLVCDYLNIETKQLICSECVSTLEDDVEVRPVMIVDMNEDQADMPFEIDEPEMRAGSPVLHIQDANKSDERVVDRIPEHLAIKAEEDQGWNCEYCTLLNDYSSSKCSACLMTNFALPKIRSSEDPPMRNPESYPRARYERQDIEDDKQVEAAPVLQQAVEEEQDPNVLSSDKDYTSLEIEASLNWKCAACTLINKMNRPYCEACYTTFTSLKRYLDLLTRPHSESFNYRRSLANKCYCKMCHKETISDTQQCTDCMLAEIRQRQALPSASHPTSLWNCPGCSRMNSSSSKECYQCFRSREENAKEERSNYEPAKYDMWKCSYCDKRNSSLHQECYYCKTSKNGKFPGQPARDSLVQRQSKVCRKCSTAISTGSLCNRCDKDQVPMRTSTAMNKVCKSCGAHNHKTSPTCLRCYKSLRTPARGYRP